VAGDAFFTAAHRRDLLRGVQLERDHVLVGLQARERLPNLLLALQRGQLARRQRALTRFGGELIDLGGTDSHRVLETPRDTTSAVGDGIMTRICPSAKRVPRHARGP
jgi:hypothetical protein